MISKIKVINATGLIGSSPVTILQAPVDKQLVITGILTTVELVSLNITSTNAATIAALNYQNTYNFYETSNGTQLIQSLVLGTTTQEQSYDGAPNDFTSVLITPKYFGSELPLGYSTLYSGTPQTNTLYVSNFIDRKFLAEGQSLALTVTGNKNNLVTKFTITYYELPAANPVATSIFNGRWTAGNFYKKNSTVFEQGSLYIARQDNSDNISPSLNSTNNWQPAKIAADLLNITAISSDINAPAGINTLTKSKVSVADTLVNKTFSSVKFYGNYFYGEAEGYSYNLPLINKDSELVLTSATQTLTNKYFDAPTTLTNPNINYTQSLTPLSAGTVFNLLSSAKVLVLPSIQTLNPGTLTLTLNSTGSMLYYLKTAELSNNTSFSIALPAAGVVNAGIILTFVVTMQSDNQTFSFVGAKLGGGRITAASTTKNKTDKYTVVSDGVNWYCIQTEKGIV